MPRFTITTLLWLFALVASALTAFDGWGLLAAAFVGLLWTGWFNRPASTATVCVWLAIAALLALLFLPGIQVPRSSSRSATCMNNMRQLGLALAYYSKKYGALPPASTRDESGRPLHSWRSLILNSIERSDVYDAIRWDEPWDSAANQGVLSPPIEVYTCPGSVYYSRLPETNYFVVTGPGTLWPPEGPRSLDNIPDGAANTVLLIEGDSGVPWSEPKDLTLADAVALLTSPHTPLPVPGHTHDPGYFFLPGRVRHLIMADGHVLAVECPISEEQAVAILTADGGGDINLNKVGGHLAPRFDWRRCGGLAMFVLVSLAPVLWRRGA